MSESKSSSSSSGKLFLVALVGAVAALLVQGPTISPFPSELNGWYPRIEYHRQLILHILNLSPDWDIASLNKAYDKHFESSGQSLPDTSNRKTAYHLDPLPEIFPESDPNWEAKLHERVSNGLPVVVRKLMYHETKTFPRAKEWSVDYLKQNVFPSPTMIPVFTNTWNDKSVIMQDFEKYVEGLQNKTRKWYARCLDDSKHVIASGFNVSRVEELMTKQREGAITRNVNNGMEYCIFVGSNHVSTRMHSDTTTSSFFMIEGRKRWVFFSAENSPYLLPTGHEMNVAYNSRVDIFLPKEELLAKYPYMSMARGHEVIIEPGDVLFFSSFSWHGVQNLDELTFGIDFAVMDPVSSFGRNAILTLGTYTNLNALVNVVGGWFTGAKGLKQAFFAGYNVDNKEAEKIMAENGL